MVWWGAWNSRSTSSWFFWSSPAPMNPNEGNWPWDKSPVILESGPPVPPLLWWTTDAGMPPCRTRWPWGEEMGTSIRTLDGDETSFSGCRRCRGILERQDSVVNYRSSELGKILEKKDLFFFSTTSPGSFFGSNFVKSDRPEHLWFSQSHLQDWYPKLHPIRIRRSFVKSWYLGSACQVYM